MSGPRVGVRGAATGSGMAIAIEAEAGWRAKALTVAGVLVSKVLGGRWHSRAGRLRD